MANIRWLGAPKKIPAGRSVPAGVSMGRPANSALRRDVTAALRHGVTWRIGFVGSFAEIP